MDIAGGIVWRFSTSLHYGTICINSSSVADRNAGCRRVNLCYSGDYPTDRFFSRVNSASPLDQWRYGSKSFAGVWFHDGAGSLQLYTGVCLGSS